MNNSESIKTALQGVIPECGIQNADTLSFNPMNGTVTGANTTFAVECPFDFGELKKYKIFLVKSEVLRKLKLESIKINDKFINSTTITKTEIATFESDSFPTQVLKKADKKAWKPLQKSWLYMFSVNSISETNDTSNPFSSAFYFSSKDKWAYYGSLSNMVILKNLTEIDGTISKDAAITAFEKFHCLEYQIQDNFLLLRNEDGVIVHCLLSNSEQKNIKTLLDSYENENAMEFHVFDKLTEIKKEFSALTTKSNNKLSLYISNKELKLSINNENATMESVTNKKNPSIKEPITLGIPIDSFFFSSYLNQVEIVKILKQDKTNSAILMSSPKKGTYVFSSAYVI